VSAPASIASESAEIERILLAEIGLDASTVGSSLVERAVQRRMEKLGIAAVEKYAALLSASEEELQQLVEEVVVPETYFFREPDAISDVVARAVASTTPYHDGAPIKILSVPCSTGEEPYSIAMSLLRAGLSPGAIAIDAMDVSLVAVRRAQEGIYRGGSFRGDMGAWKSFFRETPRGSAIDDVVRSCVRVAHGNLMSAAFQPPQAQYDVIFCRNLLIYFDTNAQERALAKLASLLAADGVLVVGAADSFAARRAGFVPARGYERSFLFRAAGEAPACAAPLAARARPRALTLATRPVKARVLHAPARVVTPPRAEAKPAPHDTRVDFASKRALVDVGRLADEGRLAEALSVGESALRDGYVTAELLSLMGTTHAALPDLESAESCYRRALFLEPDNEDALLHLALLLEKRGETALASRYRSRARRALDLSARVVS
jgi:chemotaxis protein methyltransferase WspC